MNYAVSFYKFALGLAALSLLVACGSSSSTEEPQQQDITPDSFAFIPKTQVETATWIQSEQITISGIDTDTDVSITGGEYAIAQGGFTSEAGTISNQQSLTLRVMSASDFETQSQVTVSVGGVSASFEVTTKAAPIVVEQPIVIEPASNATIDINYNLRHTVGGVDSFDRQKFITIHADLPEHDWFDGDQFSRNANNADPDLITNFLQGYDVYLGRSTGGITWNLNQIQQDPNRPGFASESDATTRGNNTKWTYNNLPDHKQSVYINEDRATDMIVGAQQHPFWPEGTLTNGGQWALSQTDSAQEPFGTATGHYMSQFIAKFFDQTPNDNVRDGQSKPKYIEVMNEPLYDLTTDRDGADKVAPSKVFHFHNTVADEIRKDHNDVLVGGYTTAFPDFDKDNFSRWHERDKLFIDIAGENMDFYSIHLYDFPAFRNSERYRRGSNVEATLDMLDNYSLKTFGETRPLVISEYGAAIHDLFNQGWNPLRNTHSIRATNSLLMAFMERPDMILKTIPFIVLKAEWGRTDVPYGPRLLVQNFEREGADAGDDWVYSDLILFYQLWAEVKGTRVDTKANDLDILVDAYIDGNTAYIIANNLEFESKEVALNHLGLGQNNVVSVNTQHLTTLEDGSNSSVIVTSNSSSLPTSITLGAESTAIIKVVFNENVNINQTLTETKYYSDLHLSAIATDDAERDSEFEINQVELGAQGEATLRLAIGRDHNLSLLPLVKFNGQIIGVPRDFRGYDQKQGVSTTGRDNYFGVIEIPVPYELLQQNNTISVEFSDARTTGDGYISSAALQVFNSSMPLSRHIQ